jgi:hypothetical protein
MSVLGNTNPIPGLKASLATLSRSAIFLQYVTGQNPDGSFVYRPGFESLGSAEKAEAKLTPTWAEVDKQDQSFATPLSRVLTKVAVEVSLTLSQMSPLVKALQVMAADPTRKYTQSIKTGVTKTLTGAVTGLAYRLGVKDVTIASVTWGEDATPAPIALVAGTDYFVDRHAGIIYLANKPAAVTPGDPIVTFSAPMYDATANLMSLGGFSGSGIRGRLLTSGRNATGLLVDVIYQDVLFSSESTISMQNNSTTFDMVELSGTLFPATVDDLGNTLSGDDAYFTVTQQSQATLA